MVWLSLAFNLAPGRPVKGSEMLDIEGWWQNHALILATETPMQGSKKLETKRWCGFVLRSTLLLEDQRKALKRLTWQNHAFNLATEMPVQGSEMLDIRMMVADSCVQPC